MAEVKPPEREHIENRNEGQSEKIAAAFRFFFGEEEIGNFAEESG